MEQRLYAQMLSAVEEAVEETMHEKYKCTSARKCIEDVLAFIRNYDVDAQNRGEADTMEVLLALAFLRFVTIPQKDTKAQDAFFSRLRDVLWSYDLVPYKDVDRSGLLQTIGHMADSSTDRNTFVEQWDRALQYLLQVRPPFSKTCLTPEDMHALYTDLLEASAGHSTFERKRNSLRKYMHRDGIAKLAAGLLGVAVIGSSTSVIGAAVQSFTFRAVIPVVRRLAGVGMHGAIAGIGARLIQEMINRHRGGFCKLGVFGQATSVAGNVIAQSYLSTRAAMLV